VGVKPPLPTRHSDKIDQYGTRIDERDLLRKEGDGHIGPQLVDHWSRVCFQKLSSVVSIVSSDQRLPSASVMRK